MAEALHIANRSNAVPRLAQPFIETAVGASYAFDPGADGLASLYATRILDRGIDPRALCAEIRADRLGSHERGAVSRALMQRSRATRFGRGTAPHLQATTVLEDHPVRLPPAKTFAPAAGRSERAPRPPAFRLSRRLAAAGLAVLLLLPFGVIAANAQESSRQARYIVQPGDTLEAVAAEFSVDPAAILSASAVQNAPYLTPDEIIIIPDSAESADEAAWNAFENRGSSPFVAGAHSVAPGETLADIASTYGVDPWSLATFNGLEDIDSLSSGQILRIPLIDAITAPESPSWTSDPGDGWESSVAPQAAGAADSGWEQSVVGPVFAVDVPAYMQMYSLSCEYAAAFIATSAFGAGVPESAFLERIGPSANPHWGYRGDINGSWGGTDNYGIYAEALVPTLNEFGFTAEVFYGADPTALTARLDAGMPVIAWLGYFGDNSWVQQDEGSYLLAPGMHVVTVYGYDDDGVYLSNPGRGNHDYYTWSDFLDRWAVIDGMALAVAPM